MGLSVPSAFDTLGRVVAPLSLSCVLAVSLRLCFSSHLGGVSDLEKQRKEIGCSIRRLRTLRNVLLLVNHWHSYIRETENPWYAQNFEEIRL